MHRSVLSKSRRNSFFPIWVRQRGLGEHLTLGHSDLFYKSLYSSFSPCHSWTGGETSGSSHEVFCLEFSPEGNILVAGCRNNSFLMFDPLRRILIRTVHTALSGSVTQVKFLNSRIFATGGTDGLVSLWDTRNLKSQFDSLRGHAYTLGNIEFSQENDMLITSTVDGITCIWDMKKCNEKGEFHKDTFWSPVLLRLRLHPDESKMIISTRRGYLLIVHELDLNTLAQDLDEFELEMFGCAYMQQTNSPLVQSASPFLFRNRRKNRVEILADFPNGGDFNVISALEIHPQGWSAFTRSTSEASGQEWTCVHDIQERENSDGDEVWRGGSGDKRPMCPLQDDAERAKRRRLGTMNEDRRGASGDAEGSGNLERGRVGFALPCSTDSGSKLLDAAFSLERGARERRSGSPPGSGLAMSSPHYSVSPDPLESSCPRSNPDFSWLLDPSVPRPSSNDGQFNRRVHRSFTRLTHYIEEPYSTKWYIESLGVSADGRLVCTPFARGIRLLAFSPECSEQSVSWCGTRPRSLHELSTHIAHANSVLCTKFSPRHCLFVSGCTDGMLVWYQPVV